MDPWEKASHCLNKKLHIIEQLAANTEAQRRFIQQRKMTGLKRLLREREALLASLSEVNEDLARDQGWKSVRSMARMLQEITVKQQAILEESAQAIRQAVAERNYIAAELRKSKVGRQVNSQYINPYVTMARGRHINEKG